VLKGPLITALALVVVGIAAPTAMAHHPPSAQTGAATAVDTGSATLAGVVDPNGSDTWYFFRYGVDRYDAWTPIMSAGDGRDPVAVSAHIEGLSAATTYHVRLVTFNRRGFAHGADVPFTTAAPAAAVPPPVAPAPPAPPAPPAVLPAPTPSAAASLPSPVLGESVTVAVRTGTVTVKPPGATAYVALSDVVALPLGSILDTREGSVTLRSALPNGKIQAAIFHGGLFEVRQPQGAAGVTELVLRGALTGCRAAPRAAATSRKKRKPPRRLWGRDSRGNFRTRGGNSVATVRGTAWYVEDRCDGTLTRVSRGSVSVYDRGRHRTVLVRAGHSYLARSIR
jgi:hypothetical protein